MNKRFSFLSPHPKEISGLLEPAILKRLQKEKRGQGFGKDYKPFLTVRDVPSRGRVHRRPALTHNRVAHLLSDLELAAFLLFDWQATVNDIREQFPLNPEVTTEIAKRLGIKHPSYRGVLQVMTTDLLVDFQVNGQHSCQAVSVKYADDLEDERTIEKLELERRYWEGEGIPWYIFTEHEVPVTSLKNVRWLAPHMHSYDLSDAERVQVFERISQALDASGEEKLAVPLKELDTIFNLSLGAHLQYFRHLAAQNAFQWDIHNQLHTNLKARDISISEYWLAKDIEYVHA
ncbi:TnsA endonuclease N-terminal domain-containing protein [Microbulbifer sp. OS29]|uniref:TnsA endonuclease N-terminal domain-containing protein n=1 Tax=Microbulbifer okhotskensis TaxID=2926617 RepID=A0A9X2ETL0_9GAMM|nr:TnsA endonuclease N-terminal domain-containing protein [Microbulbifer okhotskensis]MCO1335313.1 TnsA endonuclease N-terminal domain-containing protein [Microbulbifer okhotskensis]